jgi:hypothetical protein
MRCSSKPPKPASRIKELPTWVTGREANLPEGGWVPIRTARSLPAIVLWMRRRDGIFHDPGIHLIHGCVILDILIISYRSLTRIVL